MEGGEFGESGKFGENDEQLPKGLTKQMIWVEGPHQKWQIWFAKFAIFATVCISGHISREGSFIFASIDYFYPAIPSNLTDLHAKHSTRF